MEGSLDDSDHRIISVQDPEGRKECSIMEPLDCKKKNNLKTKNQKNLNSLLKELTGRITWKASLRGNGI